MKQLIRYFKRKVCQHKGHDFDSYAFYYDPYDIPEQAGHCKRCGYDTHETELSD